MKTDPGYCRHSFARLTLGFILGILFVPLLARGGADKIIDSIYDLRDQNEKNAWKSWEGYKEAIQDGPPPDPGAGTPWTRDDLEKIRAKNATILKHTNDRAHYQQEILKNDTDLLQKLPPNDPRRAEVEAHRQKIADQISDTRKTQEAYRGKLGEANSAIDRWRQANDPTYVPPKKTDVPPVVPADSNQPAEPQPPSEPPKDNQVGPDNSGGSGDNLAELKRKEAEKEAAARALGQERQSAVNRYLDDPSADNRQDAEDIRHRLDGMVDELNGIRDQVDQVEGTSRNHVHIRSAKAIAEEHRKNKANGTNTDGTTTQSVGACGGSGSGNGMEQHNPDGSDVSSNNSYQDVGPGGGGGNSGAHGNAATTNGAHRNTRRSQHSHTATHQHTGTNMASSESHHHAGGMNASNQQNAAQMRRRQQLQQQQQIQQQQQMQQQRRRRHPDGQ